MTKRAETYRLKSWPAYSGERNISSKLCTHPSPQNTIVLYCFTDQNNKLLESRQEYGKLTSAKIVKLMPTCHPVKKNMYNRLVTETVKTNIPFWLELASGERTPTKVFHIPGGFTPGRNSLYACYHRLVTTWYFDVEWREKELHKTKLCAETMIWDECLIRHN